MRTDENHVAEPDAAYPETGALSPAARQWRGVGYPGPFAGAFRQESMSTLKTRELKTARGIWIAIDLAIWGLGSGGRGLAADLPPEPLAVAEITQPDGTGVSSGIAGVFTNLGIHLCYESLLSDCLFQSNGLVFGPGDAGRTYHIGPGDDPAFGTFVDLFTNGRDDLLLFGTSFPNGFRDGIPVHESDLFVQLPAGSNGIDLQGFAIGSFDLRLNQLTITSPGRNPNGDGVWTDYSWNATLYIYPVPEPSVTALAAAGLAVLVFRRLATKL